MPAHRINPNRIKTLRSYSSEELARCLGVHKNTVRNWRREGLMPVDDARYPLFHGGTVREFLATRNARRKQPCPLGTIYCLRCRVPSEPALGMIDYIPLSQWGGNLRGICATCGGLMHRRVRQSEIGKVMPDCVVQVSEGRKRLGGRS